MLFFKFKLFLFLLVFSLLSSASASASASASECPHFNFDASIKHDAFPFGLTKTKLRVTKNKCLIVIDLRKLKYINKRWEIDICREPIHIKSGAKYIEVYRKSKKCDDTTGQNTAFCSSMSRVLKTLQDDGLIYASGERSFLETDHGKVYCTYNLVKNYLASNKVYDLTRPYSPEAQEKQAGKNHNRSGRSDTSSHFEMKKRDEKNKSNSVGEISFDQHNF